MLLSKVILFSLFCGIKSEETRHLGQVIHRIQKESHSSTVVINGFKDNFLTDFLQKPFNIPLIILTKFTPDENLRNADKNIILVVQVSSSFPYVAHHFVNQIRIRKFVIVHGNNLAELRQYFTFFWEKCFTRIFGVAANITYAYLPFADNQIQEFLLSNDTSLPNSLQDLNGFAFRTAVQTDPPRVFWYTGKNGHRYIGGSAGHIFLGFLKKHNATFVETVLNNLKTEPYIAILNGTIRKTIDISMNVFEGSDGLEQSYPIKLVKWSILVPLTGYVDSSQYFLRPFQPTVWLCFGLMLLYLIITDMLKDFYMKAPVNLWNSFSRILLIFINMPLQTPITKSYWFDFQVRILAFITVNFYTIFMTSFLTVYIKVKQFESIKDLIQYNVPVMMIDYDFDSYLEYSSYSDGFENLIVPQKYETFSRELCSMKNNSFAYAEGSDKLEFLIDAQIKPNFQIIRDNLQQYFLGFVLLKNSPFKEILNDFIIEVFSTGLIDKWTWNAYYQARNEGHIFSDTQQFIRELKQEARPLALYHFKFVAICFIGGIFIAIATFAMEILYFELSGKMSLKKAKK